MSRMSRRYLAASLAVFLLAGMILLAMGRVPICKCGYVKAWHGIVVSSENSQHLSDWYTFSHIIHGFAFYLLFWAIGRRFGWPLGLRLLLAVVLESAWEIFENTPLIINRYRAQTIALDYYGDSVLNSLADIAAMTAGFLLAARLPVAVIVALDGCDGVVRGLLDPRQSRPEYHPVAPSVRIDSAVAEGGLRGAGGCEGVREGCAGVRGGA